MVAGLAPRFPNRLAGAMQGIMPGEQLEAPIPAASTISEQQLAGGIWADFQRSRTERLTKDYEWHVAWAWYNGDTSIFLDRDGTPGQVYRVTNKRPRYRRNRPINLIGQAIDMLVAKQMRAVPVFDASPVSRQRQKARMGAREVRDLVRYIWDKNELKAERRILFLDRDITGNAFLKVGWNVNLPPFRDDKRTCGQCQGQGRMPLPPEVMAMQQQHAAAGFIPPPLPEMPPCMVCGGQGIIDHGKKPIGDVQVKPVSPWEVWPVPGARRVEDGVFHGFPLSVEEAASRYGLDPKEIHPSSVLERGESQFAQLARINRVDTKQDDNTAWVVERWLPPLPGSDTPRVTVVVGNRVVWPKPGTPEFEKGWTTEGVPPIQRVPFFHFRLRPAAEQFWSGGIVMDMISANDFVNRARASFHRHQQTMAYTKWFFEEGSIDHDRLIAEEGEAVPYRGAEAPVQRSPASMPQFYVDLFRQEMDIIPQLAGLQEIDRGVAPPNIEAFQALHFLAEQSETRHAPVFVEDERQWRACAWAAVRCAMHFYRPVDKRLLAIGGNAAEIKALFELDLSDSIDIRCEIGSAIAHSPALRQEMVYRAIELGAITPQQAIAKGLLDFGVILGEDSDDHRLQEAVASQENEQIIQGYQRIAMMQQQVAMLPPIVQQQAQMQVQQMQMQLHGIGMWTDDHQVHFEVHRRAAMEAKLDGNIQLAQQLEMACEAHMQAMMMQQPAPPAPAGAQGSAGPPSTGVPGSGNNSPGAAQYDAATGGMQ